MLYLVKQKTAYELRIIDWSSDVCSSGLVELVKARLLPAVFERPQVRIGEIADVDVVTNAGAVARFVVRAENLHVERLTGCAPQQLWNQVRLGCMRFADAARTAGTSRIEIAQRRGPQAVRARSEEHTSELQSLMRISYAVFCLKKKTNAILY